MEGKRGQVWIETVLYTLVGLALIGIALTFIMPKINESKDIALVEQTINSLTLLDDKANTVLENGPGNVRNIDFTIKVGELFINSETNKIYIVLEEIGKPYTEPGIDVPVGRVVSRTEKTQKNYKVTLTLDYSNIADLTFDGEEIVEKKFTPASIPYRLSFSNLGNKGASLDTLDIRQIS